MPVPKVPKKVKKFATKMTGTPSRRPYVRFSSSDFYDINLRDETPDPAFEMELLEAQKPFACGLCKEESRGCVMRSLKISLCMLPFLLVFVFVFWDKIPFAAALVGELWNPEIMTHYELGTKVRTVDRPDDDAWIVFSKYSEDQFWYQVSWKVSHAPQQEDPMARLYKYYELTIIELSLPHLPIPSADYMQTAAMVKNGAAKDRDHPGEPDPIEILSYDINCRSRLFYDTYQDVRTEMWDEYFLPKYQLVGFQEQHEVDQVLDDLEGQKRWIYIPPRSPRPGDTTPILMSSGLLIISSHEIIEQYFHTFHHVGMMRTQSSGVAFALVKTPGKHSFVFNTKFEEDIALQKNIPYHLKWMLAETDVNIDLLRQTQCQEMLNFIRAMCKHHNFNKRSDRIILMGNFNIDATQDEGRDPRNFENIFKGISSLFKEFGLDIVTEVNRTPTFPIDDPTFHEKSLSHIFIGENVKPPATVAVSKEQHLEFEIDRAKLKEYDYLELEKSLKTISSHRGVSVSISERSARP